jgi:transposase-like protein
MKTVIEMAREAAAVHGHTFKAVPSPETIEFITAFAELVRADEREVITDEWSMCVQSDLEHGVKSLNEQAAKDWFKNYPEIAKFGAWLNARSNT